MKAPLTFLILAVALSCAAGTIRAGDEPLAWRNVSPEELQMKTPKVEPDADAEAIFWEVWIDDKKESSIFYDHYVRVKIFTTRGQEKFSKFDIPFTKKVKIQNIAARVIKPDGTIINLDPKDILERDIIKAGRIKVRAKSFAIPGIEPGVIVEYRYREMYKDSWGNGLRIIFQRDIPMQKVAFHVRPQKGYSLIPKFYNMSEVAFVDDQSTKGFLVGSMTNVPAYKIEPQMPPEDEVRRWAFLTYTYRDPAVVWRNLNRYYEPLLTVFAKPTDLITKKAAEITQGATTDDDKLRRLYAFIQKDIKNLDYDRSLDEEAIEKLMKYDHAEDVLKRGTGNSVFIELLFASLLKASGFEPNLVFSGDRSEAFFAPEKHPYTSFVHAACVAVKIQNQWKYLNPSVPYLPYGQLFWTEEGVTAMLISGDGYLWQNTPISNYDRSPAKRKGKFTLKEDGSLEGEVKIEYSGHQAVSRRREDFKTSDAKRKEEVEEEVKARMSTAEVSDVAIENFDDASKPLTYSYKVRVPNYAQRTGQRLFLQPGFFEYGVKPLFSAATRVHRIHFAYTWAEIDDIEIQLPQNFALDSADTPATVADPRRIGSLRVVINYDKASSTLRYRREFHFGGGSNVLFEAASYEALRGLFDLFHKSDSHILALKEQK